MNIEPWHVLCIAVVIIFVGWCINRNRPITLRKDSTVEDAEKAAAERMKEVMDNSLDQKVVMKKGK